MAPQNFISRWLQQATQELIEQKDHLTSLDAAIGDGDHGINMARGAQAVAALDCTDFTSEHSFDAGAYLKKVGMTLVSAVGGASGPLYGTFFLRMGTTLGTNPVELPLFTKAIKAGVAGMKARGKAEYGEKTMIDVWDPVVRQLEESVHSGDDFKEALTKALAVAQDEATATIDRVATKGRASYLGPRSQGTMDPGAASSVIIIRAACDAYES